MLKLTREQILAHRRATTALNQKLPNTSDSLSLIAAAGLQDSMPRAALLSINARIANAGPDTWSKPPLVQIWGPRFSTYVVTRDDVAVFTLGRLPDEARGLSRAEDVASRLEAALAGEKIKCRDVARLMGLHPNALRYAAPTGRFLIHWDGARQPLIWSVPAPEVDPGEARVELARRYLRVFGPAGADSFSSWAGVRSAAAAKTFDDLQKELVEVMTPIGEKWILESDEHAFLSELQAVSTRLLPSGDSYYLLQGDDRGLLVPNEAQQRMLWTSRVWPGAVLQGGEIVGTWRRSQHKVTVDAWGHLTNGNLDAIEQEASAFPLPGLTAPIQITWI